MSEFDKTNKLESQDFEIPNREDVLNVLNIAGKPIKEQDIFISLNIIKEEQKIALKRRLRAMERDGQIIFNKRNRYALPEKMDLLKGTVIGHKDGFGFLHVPDQENDLFIPYPEMRKVMHGDLVLAQVVIQKKGRGNHKGKREVRIVRILENANNQIVGRYFIENGLSFVVPDDTRINRDILIPSEDKLNARMGQVVVVELQPRKASMKQPIGKIIEILGEKGDKGIETEIAIRNHKIPYKWPDSFDKILEQIKEEVPLSAKKDRVDLTKLPLVTIDGEDARDFDDAVYCEAQTNGDWKLWVAIADVSNYVTYNSELDKEAKLRGNSVYFPNRVIPMLPEKLSNGLCSLNPQVDRLCMVCELTIDPQGNIKDYKFYEAVINSFARLTYNKVWAILQGDVDLRERYKYLVDDLENLYKLYKVLALARKERGAISFESEETKFIFNAHGTIDYIEPLIRNDAHKLIEECMIIANIAAAKFLDKYEMNALFRVHLPPTTEKLTDLKSFLKGLSLTLKGGIKPTPKDYEDLLEEISERPDHELIQIMLLRSMQQAVYQNQDLGHFGLALTEYAHFTSPIRRYPDLVVHRSIKYILKNKNKNYLNKDFTGQHRYEEKEVFNLGNTCSMTERRADEATRDVDNWLKCEYMQDRIGSEFDGVISGVIGGGFFVRLPEFGIDGFVHISVLANDYYIYDHAKQRLIGENTRIVYKIGDSIKIKVSSVSLEEKRINFVLAEEPILSTKNNKKIKKTSKNKVFEGSKIKKTNDKKRKFKKPNKNK